MSRNFYHRLRDYYLDVARVLRGEASAGSIFPNSTDVGQSRELVYAEFLRQHAPSKCNVFLGGFLFGMDGSESKQLDVLITTDTTPRFNFLIQDGAGKSFSCVEGTLGAVSIKSTLDKKELFDALEGIASIPPTLPIAGRTSFAVTVENYDDWPYKVVYASDGIRLPTLMKHLEEFYLKNPDIPLCRRPQMIHVAGKYVVLRVVKGMKIWTPSSSTVAVPPVGHFFPSTVDPDIQGISWVLFGLQERATASNHILLGYSDVMNSVMGIPPRDQRTGEQPPQGGASEAGA